MKIKLNELIKVRTGKLDANAANENGQYPFFTCSKEPLSINTYSYDCECVLVAGNGDLNVKYYNGKFDAYQRTYILESSSNKLYMPYLYLFMDKYVDTLRKQSIGGVIKYIKLEYITNASIELPEVNSQKEICNKIYKVKGLINNQKKAISYLDTLIKSRFVEMFYNKGLTKIKIKEVVNTKIINVKSIYNKKDIIKYIDISSINNSLNQIVGYSDYCIEEAPSRAQQVVQYNDILVSTVRPNLKNVAIVKNNYNNLVASTGYCVLRPMNCLSEFLFYSVLDDKFTDRMTRIASGASYPAIHDSDVLNYEIMNPSIEVQNQFATFVQQVDKLKLYVQKSLEKTQMLFDSLLQEYFG